MMFDFIKRYPDNLNLSTMVRFAPAPVNRDVDMIVGDASAATRYNRNYTAFQMSLEHGKNEVLTCAEQRATYYIGGICCLMPEVTDVILQGVPQRGNRVRVVRVSSGSKPNGLVIPHKKANAFFGFLVVMLYKNVTEATFGDLSDRLLKELFDAAGYAPRKGEEVSVFNVACHARAYRCFGQLGRVKESVLKGVLNHSKAKDSFGSVCSCVAKFLSWMDVAGFHTVYKTLALTDSPVLRSS